MLPRGEGKKKKEKLRNVKLWRCDYTPIETRDDAEGVPPCPTVERVEESGGGWVGGGGVSCKVPPVFNSPANMHLLCKWTLKVTGKVRS